MELLPVLTGVLVAVATITVVGHGIWVLLARLSRALMAPEDKYPPAKIEPCLFCNQPTPAGQHYCQWCNANLRSVEASYLSDLKAAQRSVKHLRDNAILDVKAADDLLEMLRGCRGKLLAARAAVKPIRAPTAVPAAARAAVVPATLVETARRRDRRLVLAAAASGRQRGRRHPGNARRRRPP